MRRAQDNEYGRAWKEAIMTSFMILYWYVPGDTEENHEYFNVRGWHLQNASDKRYRLVQSIRICHLHQVSMCGKEFRLRFTIFCCYVFVMNTFTRLIGFS